MQDTGPIHTQGGVLHQSMKLISQDHGTGAEGPQRLSATFSRDRFHQPQMKTAEVNFLSSLTWLANYDTKVKNESFLFPEWKPQYEKSCSLALFLGSISSVPHHSIMNQFSPGSCPHSSFIFGFHPVFTLRLVGRWCVSDACIPHLLLKFSIHRGKERGLQHTVWEERSQGKQNITQ